MDPSTGDQSLYRTNTTNIEVVLKKMSNGEKLTFMRFVFPRYGRLDKGPQSAKKCIFSLSFSVTDFFSSSFSLNLYNEMLCDPVPVLFFP